MTSLGHNESIHWHWDKHSILEDYGKKTRTSLLKMIIWPQQNEAHQNRVGILWDMRYICRSTSNYSKSLTTVGVLRRKVSHLGWDSNPEPLDPCRIIYYLSQRARHFLLYIMNTGSSDIDFASCNVLVPLGKPLPEPLLIQIYAVE